MDRPGHPVLILRRAELFRLCAVGEETALHDYNGHIGFFQQIIAVVGLDLTLVLRIRPLHQLILNQLRQSLSLSAARIIKHLRAMHILLRIAVLMYAHRQSRRNLVNDLDPPLHVLHLFVGRLRIVQPLI